MSHQTPSIRITIDQDGRNPAIEAHVSGAEIKRDFWTKRITSVGAVQFRYSWDGKLQQVGNAKISYNFSGQINQVGYDSRLDIIVSNLST